MSFGAEVFGDNGKLQIGGEGVYTFQLVQKGSGVASTSQALNITPTVPYDVLAISTDFYIIPKSIFPTTLAANTTQQFRKISGEVGTYTWYAFRSYKAMAPSPSGAGIEIYNPDGTVSFSSVQPQILKVTKIPVTDFPLFNTTVAASRKYAFLSYGTVCHKVTATEPMGGGTILVSCYPFVKQDSTTNVAITTNIRTSRISSTPEGYMGGIMLTDVTGY